MLLKSGLCKEKEENSHAILLAEQKNVKAHSIQADPMGDNSLTPHCSESTVKFTTKQSFKVRTQRQMVLIS